MSPSVGVQQLGAKGVCVPSLGFGCGPTAGLMINGSPDDRRMAVAAALEAGISLFDTSPSYGAGRSELHLGETLRMLGASASISTKVMLNLGDLSDIPSAVRRSVHRSLERLGCERIALLHLHNRIGAQRAERPNLGVGTQLSVDDVVGEEGVAAGFEALAGEGLVEAFCCSAYGGEMDSVARVIGSGRFSALVVNYSLLNASAFVSPWPFPATLDYRGVGRAAAANGLGVIALRLLEGGVLAAPDGANEEADHLRRLFAGEGISLKEAAIRFAISRPEISMSIIGFSSAENVREILGYCARGPLALDLLGAYRDWVLARGDIVRV